MRKTHAGQVAQQRLTLAKRGTHGFYHVHGTTKDGCVVDGVTFMAVGRIWEREEEGLTVGPRCMSEAEALRAAGFRK